MSITFITHYDDIDDMVGAMRKHAAETKHSFAIKEDNDGNNFGFIDHNDKSNWFVISKNNFFNSINKMSNQDHGELLKEAFSSNEGKLAFLNVMFRKVS